jgi:aspartate kinase
MIVVQKFGGTCVETAERRELACQRVKDALQEGNQVVVVVSAMGRSGEPYATDTLISLARQVHHGISAREMDLLVSCGEIVSAVVMVQELQERGIEAVALSGGQAGIVTDAAFGDAKITSVEPDYILGHLNKGRVVVVAGFQGRTPSGEITTLGRGGSDMTATALGGALNAACVEIYTDVEGIMTADPRIVTDAKTIPLASYDEVTQLAREGARVVQPRAVEMAQRAGLPVWIRSMSEESRKTLMTCGKKDNLWLYWTCGRPIAGVTSRSGLAQVLAHLPDEREMETTAKAFELLKGISLDLINVFPDHFSVAVDKRDAGRAVGLLESLGIYAGTLRDKAKVTAVGYGISGRPGIMERLVDALWSQKIHVYASSDSNTSLSCLVDEEQLNRAVNVVHSACAL